MVVGLFEYRDFKGLKVNLVIKFGYLKVGIKFMI